MKLSFKILSLIIIAGIVLCENTIAQKNRKPSVTLRLEPGEDNPRNSEGDFITLKDDKILFIYSHFSGSSGSDFGHGYLASRYSLDKGETWSKEDQPVVKQEGDMNVMSVSLLRLKNGTIALFYLRKNSEEDCMPMMRISNDETRTWSDPISCKTDKQGYFVLVNNRVIQLKNGRLLMPVALHRPLNGKWKKKATIYTYYSDNNGATWICSDAVPNNSEIITQEPGVVALKDGRIMMYMRTDRGVQYFSYSEDDGETWSAVEPGNIPSPRSPATIKRIPATGDLLLVWNNKGWPIEAETGRKVLRTPFNSAISKDEGATWTHVQAIGDDPNTWYDYPAIHFIDNNVLVVNNGGYFTDDGRSVIDHTDDEIIRRERRSYLQINKISIDWLYNR